MASQTWDHGLYFASMQPFTKAESRFTDARFFEENDALKETMPSTITSMGKGGINNVL